MFCRSLTFLAFLGLTAAFVLEGSRTRRSAHYQGPPAPLNKDGTVALTPEVQHAREAHDAAIAAELKRLEEAKNLAAAHPDLTSPKGDWYPSVHLDTSHVQSYDKGHHVHNSGQYSHDSHGHYSHGIYNQGPSKYFPKKYMPAPLNKDGTVALTPEVQMAKEALDAAFKAELKRLMEAANLPDRISPYEHKEYSSGQNNYEHTQEPSYHYHSKNPEAHMPAPLNPDGTVAQTAAYNAIASSLSAEYMKILHNIKHQPVDPNFQKQVAQKYKY